MWNDQLWELFWNEGSIKKELNRKKYNVECPIDLDGFTDFDVF